MSTKSRKSTKRSYEVNTKGRVVGIDPGKTGGLVLLEDDEWIDCLDMPMLQMGNITAPFVDGLAVRRWIIERAPDEIVIEAVASRPGQGVATTFRFGASYGSVVGVALSTQYPVTLVPPAVWKRRAGLLGTSKDAARLLALKLFPRATSSLKRKKDIGRADAGLIARFGR